SPSASVPLLIEGAPLRPIVMAAGAQRLGVGHAQGPSERGILKYVAFHRNDDSRCAGRRCGDGLERGGRALGGGPCCKPAVALAVHAHTTVAPGLLGDPIDDRTRILAVMLIGHHRRTAFPLAAAVGHYAGIAVSGAVSG